MTPRALSLLTVVALAACGRAVPPRFAVPPRPDAADTRAAPAVAAPVVRPPWVAHRVVADAVAVPGGRRHTVKAGETGIAIARAYGVPWSKVVAANHLRSPFTIEIGDTLLLPNARALAAQSPAERARAFRIDIDDLITGGEPAENLVGRGAGPAASGARTSAATAGRPTPPHRSGTRASGPPTANARAALTSGRAPTATIADARPPAVVAEPRPAPLPAVAGPAPTFAWPLEGRVLSAFGANPGGRYNDGVNLKASPGTAVRAAADGVVAYAGDAVAGFGNLVLIKHADGWVSAYGHNETLLVARGARVAKGEVVARSGATGAVDEPQLHFELRHGRTASDPLKLLPPRG